VDKLSGWSLLVAHPRDENHHNKEGVGHAEIKLIRDLFENKWLTSEMITDKMIFGFMGQHCGWDHNDEILKTLVEFLPKERWSKMLDKHDDGGHSTILHAIWYTPKCHHQYVYWVNKFIELGCDPRVKDGQGSTILPYAIRGLHHEIVTLLVNEFKMDVNETGCDGKIGDYRDELYNDRKSPLIYLLDRHALDKSDDELEPVKRMISFLNDHGLDWSYRIPMIEVEEIKRSDGSILRRGRTGMGCCAHDFVHQYGWTEYLGKLVPEAKDYKMTQIVEYGFRDKAERLSVLKAVKGLYIYSEKDKDSILAEKYYAKEIKMLQDILDEIYPHRFTKNKDKIDQFTGRILMVIGKIGDDFMRLYNHHGKGSSDRWLEGFYSVGPIYEYFQTFQKK
jgi:hypothetical protein